MKIKILSALFVVLSCNLLAQESDFFFGPVDSASIAIPAPLSEKSEIVESTEDVPISTLVKDTLMPESQASPKRVPLHPLRKGSYFQFGFGGGLSQLLYDQCDGQERFYPAGTVNVGYTYFFLPYMGIGTGVYLSSYGSQVTLNNEYVWNGVTDSEGDTYNHHAQMNNWVERQMTYMVEIPLALHFQHNFNRRAGIYAAIGAKIGIPIYSDYQVLSGSITHTGYYPQWDLTLHDTHDFYTEENQKQTNQLANPIYSYKGFVEFGGLFQISKRTDLFVGAFLNYGFNKISPVADQDRIDVGFKNSDHQFMNTYNGLIGTKAVGNFNTASVGLKLGFNIYAGSLASKNKKIKKEKEPKIIYVYDTLIVKDTLVLRDTILINQAKKEMITKAADGLDKVLSKAVIYFDFDKFDPKIQPSDLLDKVAAILIEHPDMGVEIGGYACKTGSDEYNQRLAMKRAQTVADRLKQKGVNSSQMKVTSYGASHPFKYNDHSHQISKDRRVEIVPIGYVEKPVAVATTTAATAVAQKPREIPTVFIEGIGEVPVFLKYTEFIGEEEVKKGVYLAQISRKWYHGEQAFWVYIYEANMYQIPDPNNLETGLTLMIPKLAPELIDPNNPACIDAANALKEKYLNQK